MLYSNFYLKKCIFFNCDDHFQNIRFTLAWSDSLFNEFKLVIFLPMLKTYLDSQKLQHLHVNYQTIFILLSNPNTNINSNFLSKCKAFSMILCANSFIKIFVTMEDCTLYLLFIYYNEIFEERKWIYWYLVAPDN